MSHKVIFRSVFVLAVALGLFSVAVRAPKDSPTEELPPALQKGRVDPLSRPLAAYRVSEQGIVGGMKYRGAGYEAQVAESGVRFGSKDSAIEIGTPRVEQGGLSLECAKGTFARNAFGVATLDRGAVREGYYFENRRVEQTFTFPAPLAQGALTVRIPVQTSFAGPVVAHSPTEPGLKEMEFLKGGLAFCDATGATRIAYHSAIAVDAQDRRVALAPRYENREIVLEVPAAFMADAAYPVVIDPWLGLGGSSSGGGLSGTQQVSDRPSVAVAGAGNPFIAWADNPTGNYEIYATYWNGFEFKDLGGSTTGNGISNTPGGKSVNPHLALSSVGVPNVTWQDDEEGRVGIYFRRWNGSAWESLSGPNQTNSGSGGGLSATFLGPALYPRVAVVSTWVDNTTLPRLEDTAMLTWEEGGTIVAAWHYPGDNKSTPGPAGWYPISPPSGLAAGSPSITRDSLGRPSIAWHDASTGIFEVSAARLEDGVTAANPIALTFLPLGGGTRTRATLVPPLTFNPVVWNGGQVSATPTQLSMYPAITSDGTTLNLAWQETTPGGATGTNTEIFMAQNSGGGWGAVSTSLGAGGISQSPGTSMSPAIASANGVINVAWVDDTGGNFEIYVRQSTAGGAWNQIGVQGSAAPLLGGDTVAPTGGVSLTSTLSLTPAIACDQFGNPTVVWADGGSQNSLDILMKQFSPNGPGFMNGSLAFITDLRQTLTDPVIDPFAIDLVVGGFTGQTTMFLSASLFTEPLIPPGTTLRLQAEVQEASTPFTGTPTIESITAPPGTRAVITFSGLPNRNYKWQVRTMDQMGRFSPYVQFPTSGSRSFGINAGGIGGPGGPPPNPGAGSGPSKGSCGLTGLEGFLLLMLLRRRKK